LRTPDTRVPWIVASLATGLAALPLTPRWLAG
jgi:hypothetical protein